MNAAPPRRLILSAAWLAAAACSATHHAPAPPAPAAPPASAAQPLTPIASSCLPGERGVLRASLRGAIDADLDWRGASLQCEGGARPADRGVRLSFLGPADAQGRHLRLVFGIAVPPGTSTRHGAPTNITVIVEGRNRIYATQGDERCTTEALVQNPLGPVASEASDSTDAANAAAPSPGRLYRIAARGECIDPATTLDGSERLYINRFDFAGEARFEDHELHEIAARTDARP